MHLYNLLEREKAGEQCIHGVNFAVKTKLIEEDNLIPIIISISLMTLQIPLMHCTFLTLTSIYAPTLVSDDGIKESYDLYDSIIQNIPVSIQLVVFGHFDARVDCDHHAWKSILSCLGIGNCNTKVNLLLGLCSKHNLTVTHTLF